MDTYTVLGSRPQKRFVPAQVLVLLVVCLCSAVRGADAQDAGCSASSVATADAIGPKNRFISFNVGDIGLTQAIRVTFGALPAPFDIWNGVPMWVSPPSAVNKAPSIVKPNNAFGTIGVATLQCESFCWDWIGSCSDQCFGGVNEGLPCVTTNADCPGSFCTGICVGGVVPGDGCSSDTDCSGFLHVFYEGIVPGAEYDVEVIDCACNLEDEVNYSSSLTIQTAKFGDTVSDCSAIPCGPADGTVHIIDVLAILHGFGDVPTGVGKLRADIEPGCLDLIINISDVVFAVMGFQGVPYPFVPTAPDPCLSKCPAILPR